jgi:hypothetical protein
MTRTQRIPSVTLVCAIATTALTVPAFAQERSNRRTLDGHSFLTTSFVGDPFVGTYIATLTGAGRALDMQVPVYDLDGNQIAILDGNIAFLQLGFTYQQQLVKWLALRLNVTGAARMGTNHVSLLAEGATAVYGGSFGAVFRLVESQKLFLSALAEMRGNSLYAISPLSFAEDVIESGGIDSTTQLLGTGDNGRFVGGVRAAYAFAPWLGITGLAEFGPAKRFFEDDAGDRNTTTFDAGGTVSLDLRPVARVPLGFVGSFLYQSENERGDDLVGKQTVFGLGVFYTGRQDFQIGVELNYQRLDQQGLDNKINASQIKLLLRYDF